MEVSEEKASLVVKLTKLESKSLWTYSINERRIKLAARNAF